MDVDKIKLWEKHFLENPRDVIPVLAVIASTHPLLTIEEENEQEDDTVREESGESEADNLVGDGGGVSEEGTRDSSEE